MAQNFAEIFASLRREKRLSQRKVAADLNISQALLSHYENGLREPRLEFVAKACDYYGVSADYLLGRTNTASNPLVVRSDDARETMWSDEEVQSVFNAVAALLLEVSDAKNAQSASAVLRYLRLAIYKLFTSVGYDMPDGERKSEKARLALCDAAMKIEEAEALTQGADVSSEWLMEAYPELYDSVADLLIKTAADIREMTHA